MKLIAIVAVVAIMATTVCASTDFEQFLAFVKTYNRQYDSMEEFEYRYSVFQQGLTKIAQLRAGHFNATGEDGTNVYTVTKFADLTTDEFRSRHLGFRPRANRDLSHIEVARSQPMALPTKFDWRDRNAVSPVKDQGDCGSCWAFSATEEIESMAFLQNQTSTADASGPETLAVQQIVSCDTTDGGCDGGDTPTAYAYVQKAGGLETNAEYPYTSGNGNNGKCNDKKADEVVNVKNFTYATPPCTDSCKKQDETLLMNNLAAIGPVSICVYAESWQFYGSGILSSDCPASYSTLDHCVQLVGYDISGKTPYWIVRNSWNTDWGIDGYIWIAQANNLCGVADEATITNTIRVQKTA